MKLKFLTLALILFAALQVAPSSFAAHRTFLTPSLFPTGKFPWAATVQDFNNDGKADVATANTGDEDVSVLLGNGKGGFLPANTFAVGAGVSKIAGGDLDGDGNADLVVTDGIKAVDIALGHGDGTFAPASAIIVSDRPTGIAISDLDGDGVLDLAIACLGNNSQGSVAVLIGVGDGSFAPPVFYSFTPPQAAGAVVATDLNHDGQLDLAVALSHFPSANNSLAILLGNGDGTFQPAVLSIHGNADDIAAEDFNQDGDTDLALTIDGTANVLLGNGDGTFQTPISTGTSATTVATADMNRDRIPDLVVGGFDTGVLLGNGDGTFGPVTKYGMGNLFYNVFAEVGYFNQDRFPDVIAQGNDSAIAVALGTRDGILRAPVLVHGGSLSFTSGDFDGDGYGDVVDAVPFSFIKGLGNGTFALPVQISDETPAHLTATDLNGDRKLDLLGTSGQTVLTFLGNGDGTFQAPQGGFVPDDGLFPAVGDFNHDGYNDVAVTAFGDDHLFILLGNGDGTFQPPITYSTGQFPESLVAADFNGDGNLDLATGNEVDSTVGVYLGNGDGTFAAPLTLDTAFPVYSAAGDVNGDGNADLIIGGGNALKLYLSNGDGTFQLPQSIYPKYGPTKVADLDGDGRPDIAFTPSFDSDGTVVVFRGRGDGTFGDGVAYPIGKDFSGFFDLTDLNGDGRPEAIVNDVDFCLSILLNISVRR